MPAQDPSDFGKLGYVLECAVGKNFLHEITIQERIVSCASLCHALSSQTTSTSLITGSLEGAEIKALAHNLPLA
jgi:hypothetical protein